MTILTGKSSLLSSMNGPVSIAMWNNQRVLKSPRAELEFWHDFEVMWFQQQRSRCVEFATRAPRLRQGSQWCIEYWLGVIELLGICWDVNYIHELIWWNGSKMVKVSGSCSFARWTFSLFFRYVFLRTESIASHVTHWRIVSTTTRRYLSAFRRP
jgi:hypothetical protein